jgi:hypothetical protein
VTYVTPEVNETVNWATFRSIAPVTDLVAQGFGRSRPAVELDMSEHAPATDGYSDHSLGK